MVGPTVSVVVPTRDRPELVERAVRGLLAQSVAEVVVVDDHSVDPEQPAALVALAELDRRVRIAATARRGASAARNTGLALARHDVVAFIDDDVEVAPGWLEGLHTGLARWPDACCITGPVRARELETQWQVLFEHRVGWDRGHSPELYRPDDRHRGRLYPFRPGQYGVGANFAVHRAAFDRVGGFDERFGPGSRLRSAEDVDLFVRLVRTGGSIGFEPSALAFHTHRRTEEAFRQQLRDYGTGLGSWLVKMALEPGRGELVASAVRRHGPAGPVAGHRLPWAKGGWDELRGLMGGPLAYAGAGRASHRKRYNRVEPSE